MSPLTLLLLLFLLLASATDSTSPADIAALAAFKAAISPTSINPWSCLASWNFASSPVDPCSPTPPHFLCGLTCSGNRITAIVLDPAGYSGLLSPSLANLTLLSHLDLSDNAFHGPLPSSLSSLSSSLLSFILASNSFSGPIPSFLSALSSLQTLDLSRNAFTGPIPQALASLHTLETMDLSFNRLSGVLPANLPPNLVVLALRGNSIAGTLMKSTFAPLHRLEVVELAANRLVGKLQGWFFMLSSLQQVNLSNNSLNSLEVWGGGGGGSEMVAVDLGFNRIEGELPVGLAAYPSLAALSLRHNRLRGAIPWQYYYLKKGAPFRRLFLDGNFLNGRVPNGFLTGGGGDGGGVSGSFGDNCLDSCPAKSALCSPAQKPNWVCKQVYGRPLPASSFGSAKIGRGR